MKFVDLLSFIDEDSYLIIQDADGNERIEFDASNTFLQLFDDCKVIKIYGENLYIDLEIEK